MTPDVTELRSGFRYAMTGTDGLVGLPSGIFTVQLAREVTVSNLPEAARNYFNGLKGNNTGPVFGQFLIKHPEYVMETRNNMEKA
jgi:hypothetical protein